MGWTKRPQNFCRSCKHSWYPRGHNRSARCPECKSPEVELALEGCLRAVGYLIVAPLVLPALLLALLCNVLLGAAVMAWAALWGTARAVNAGTTKAVEHSAPARAAALDWAAQVGRRCLAGLSIVGMRCVVGLAFVGNWLLSVRHDLAPDQEQDVNPVSLVAKLLVIVAGAVSAGMWCRCSPRATPTPTRCGW